MVGHVAGHRIRQSEGRPEVIDGAGNTVPASEDHAALSLLGSEVSKKSDAEDEPEGEPESKRLGRCDPAERTVQVSAVC